MELMLVGIIKVPDDLPKEELARLETAITASINLDVVAELNEPTSKPLVWWSLHKLVAPLGD